MESSQILIPEYHAHIYFEANSISSAETLRNLIALNLGELLHYQGRLIDRPIGPHSTGMFEINFKPDHFGKVVQFLILNHGSHSVLIHPYSGNDLADHTNYALWLGPQLLLHLEKL